MSRKRGAQPGNQNALRHGFYSHFLRQQEIDDLDAYDISDFASEIAMLRAHIRRVVELGDGVADLDAAIRQLDSLGTAAHHVASMIYKHQIMTGDKDGSIGQALSEALAEVAKELNLK